MTKRYVKSLGVYCPSCGKSRGVELLAEELPEHPVWGNLTHHFIRCRHEGKLFMITDMGSYPSYDSPRVE